MEKRERACLVNHSITTPSTKYWSRNNYNNYEPYIFIVYYNIILWYTILHAFYYFEFIFRLTHYSIVSHGKVFCLNKNIKCIPVVYTSHRNAGQKYQKYKTFIHKHKILKIELIYLYNILYLMTITYTWKRIWNFSTRNQTFFFFRSMHATTASF